MIKSKIDYIFYKEADRIISGRVQKTLSTKLKHFFVPDNVGKFMCLLRVVEYYENCKKGILSKILGKYFKYKFRKISLKLGFSIPPNIFGPGLLIPHYGTIVINMKATVGSYCVLHTSTCITAKDHINIGDNFYLSTGSIISGNIEIKDSVTVGANSLVNKSFNEINILIGGSPAKLIKERKAWYLEDGIRFEQRIHEINELRNKLYKQKK